MSHPFGAYLVRTRGQRTVRLVARATTLGFLIAAMLLFAYRFVGNWPGTDISGVGLDYRLYMEATAGWLAGGEFYPDRQLAGPYRIVGAGEILYPPISLILFLPFTVLPPLTWYLTPICIVGWALYRLRPAWWAQPILAALCCWGPTQSMVLFGNPGMYSVAALSLVATGRPWAGALGFAKVSLGPVLLFGAWHRSWWYGAGVAALLSVPFGTMWLDWLRVVTNEYGRGLLYSVRDLPIMAIPLLAWATRTEHAIGSSPSEIRRSDPLRLALARSREGRLNGPRPAARRRS